MADNYNENESRIPEENPSVDRYDSQLSRIQKMESVFDDYSSSVDLVSQAEVEYERLRTLNKEALIRTNIEEQVNTTLGNLSLGSIVNNPGGAAAEQALNTLRSTTLARAVGPVSELPFTQLEDGIRREIILSDTMIGPEQKLLAKLNQMRGNTYSEEYDYLRQELLNPEFGATLQERATEEVKREVSDVIPGVGPLVYTNTWSPDREFTKKEAMDNWAYDETDQFPFKIRNLASNGVSFEIFPAYISNFNESVSPSWSNMSLVNRSEDIYIYQRADRSFNLEFVLFSSPNPDQATPQQVSEDVLGYSIVPQETPGSFVYATSVSNTNAQDFPLIPHVISKEEMWRKVNFLHQCTRPLYSETGRYSKAPYLRFWLGGIYHNKLMIIESLNIGFDPLIWDLNGIPDASRISAGIKPMIANITIGGKILHGGAPGSTDDFYSTPIREMGP